MLPIIAGIVSSLFSNNLPKVAQAVIDKGLDYVEDKLGIKIDTTVEGSLSPEKLAEIKAAAMKHEEFQIEQANKNTADARAMQVSALAQSDVFSKRYVYYLASFWSVFSVIYITLITFCTIPLQNVRFADTILGFLLGTIIATVINYFFGSSRSSALKTELLNKKE